ncbi:UDP-N-acetylglucosamine 2-epimerase (hydrolyzing), partial [Streptococcus agalactiae]|nr:UDP-N-acetylglucosamine 2-epimerase (hydrolyzing) [Streptococcus agalactiae]
AKAINTYLINHENSCCFASLSTQLYHSLIRHSLGLIGNSSSGLIEVPSLMKPTLNIGDRQKGRLHGESVVSVPVETSSVLEGLSKLNEVTNFDNPYYKGNASSIAYEAIKLYLKDEPSISQPFYDLKENNLK